MQLIVTYNAPDRSYVGYYAEAPHHQVKVTDAEIDETAAASQDTPLVGLGREAVARGLAEQKLAELTTAKKGKKAAAE